ncbi:MAG: glycosyltransferase family 10 [Pseudomonadota bacterium]
MIYANIHAAGHSNNSLFAAEDKTHRYNPTYMPRLLRESFLAEGIEINTPDINRGRAVAFDLHLEGRHFIEDGIPKYLIALENPNINRLNENRDYCSRFDKVFAWDMRLHDLPNAVKILVPNQLTYDHFPAFAERDIFSCLINANKAFSQPLASDLYLERINTIRWYERYAPDQFGLYGMGWAKPTPTFNFRNKVKRPFIRLATRLFGYQPFSSYRGEITNKREVLHRSKFSYCYENTRGLSNYITEKIFDSLLSGCVPIYWGADNILEYIPAGCFIDRRNFDGTAAVHEFLLSVSSEDYARYQSNIIRFLEGDVAKKFSAEYFVSMIVEHVAYERGKKSTQLFTAHAP